MKKILIALDNDLTADKVASTGAAIAKAMGAEVVLIHVIADIVYYSTSAYNPIMGFTSYIDIGQLEVDPTDALKKASVYFLDRLKKHLNDTSIQTEVKQGDVAESITAAAKDLHADMIVIGAHSQKWLASIIIGSVAEKVLQHTNIPILIVPTKKED
jgi:nucleotide-binding universal stress UspA family protein